MEQINCQKVIRYKKILLVEDNAINIRVAKLILKECGIFDITVAENGNKAITLFTHDFDLVVLDIGLPDISGLEVCAAIRNLSYGKKVPIVMCTADSQSQLKAKSVGANDYLVKPITINEIQKILNRWLG